MIKTVALNGMENLRVLLVEDQDYDIELVSAALRRQGLKSDLRVVKSGSALRAILPENTFDIILSDFNLSDIDGFGILEFMREQALDIPVVVVSASIGEETAAGLIRNGARDYVLKDNLSRLGLAIRTTMENQQQKRTLERQEALERSLAQSYKLQSIGMLAAGIAHEINNPLFGMMNYAELIKDTLPDQPEVIGYANEIIKEGSRIAHSIREVLDFSRNEGDEVATYSVETVIDSAIAMLSKPLKRDHVQLVRKVDANLPALHGRVRELQHVVMNLIENARTALVDGFPQGDPGREVFILAQTANEATVEIRVQDHGPGIPLEHLNRIFEPFFTTKPQGQATGLGLFVSKSIVERHGGTLTVESSAADGVTFTISLPVNYSG